MGTFISVILSVAVLLFILRQQYRNRKRATEKSEEIDQLLKGVEVEDWCQNAGRDKVMDRFDRLVFPPLDDVRRFSNAALIIGIGGTMGIFFIEALILYLYPSVVETSSSLPRGIIISGAIALFSSLLGVGFHLYISLEILDRAQKSIGSKERDIEKEIEKRSRAKTENAIEDLKEQPASSIDAFVKVIESLLEGQRSLDSSIKKAVQQQSESAAAMKETVEQLAGNLGALPENIRIALDSSKVFKKVAKSYIGKLSDLFIDHRGRLNETIVKNQDELKKVLVRQLVNQSDAITQRIYEPLQEKINENIVVPLDKLRQQLNATTNELNVTTNKMPHAVQEFVLVLQESVIQKIYEPLEETIRENIVAPLDRMREQLDLTTDEMPHVVREARKLDSELQKSSEALKNISKELEVLPSVINKAASEATFETLKPVSDQMKNFNGTVEDTHKKLVEAIEGLVNLIKKLCQEIEIKDLEKR